MKNNKIIIFSFIIVILSFILINLALDSEKGSKVDNYEATILINNDGSISVSETWVVKYDEGYSVSFRDIAYEKYNEKNPLRQVRTNTASFDTTSVSVEVYNKDGIKLNENEYRVGYSFRNDKDELNKPIECYPDRSSCESIFIQVYGGMQSRMTFKYNYTIKGAITKYSDIAELNWRLIEYFEDGINNAKVEIIIPNANENDIYAWGHGLSAGTVDIQGGKVILDIDKIRKEETLEFRILFPKDLVNVEPKNDVGFPLKNEIIAYEDELARLTNRSILIAQVIFYSSFALIAVTAYVIYVIYNKYDKEHKASFDGKYYRELPNTYTPAEMSYLYYFGKINDEDLTATLLDLIRKKYLILDTAGESVSKIDPNFKLIKNEEENNLDKLLPHEKHLLKWFINDIGDGKEVTLKQIENYPKRNYAAAQEFERKSRQFIILAMDAGKSHDFFDDVDKNKAYSYLILPSVFLIIALLTQNMFSINNTFAIIVSIIIIICLVVYISSIKRRSINGNEDYVKWKAFKNFLEDFGRMEDYPMPGIVIWEHYLVYATSLKIADKVMEQLKVRLPSVVTDEELNRSTFIGFGYRYYGFNLNHAFTRINSSISTARFNSVRTIQTHNSSKVSIGGRGGGFGGGSSFGGGGGGFRSR